MAPAFELSWPIGHCLYVGPTPVTELSDDVRTVVAARNGDRDAFGRLYERYVRMVHGMLLSRVPPGDVDDLVQDVFTNALTKLAGLRDPAAFGGWLAMIARNRATDYHRRSVEVLEVEERHLRQEAAPPESLAVLEKIQSLPEAYRETLILRLVEGMTGPEIAQRTGLTPGSVRVNLHRGMAMLRERLEARP